MVLFTNSAFVSDIIISESSRRAASSWFFIEGEFEIFDKSNKWLKKGKFVNFGRDFRFFWWNFFCFVYTPSLENRLDHDGHANSCTTRLDTSIRWLQSGFLKCRFWGKTRSFDVIFWSKNVIFIRF